MLGYLLYTINILKSASFCWSVSAENGFELNLTVEWQYYLLLLISKVFHIWKTIDTKKVNKGVIIAKQT